MSVRIVAKGLYNKLGEGPYWEASSNSLLSVELFENVLHKYNAITEQMEKRNLKKNASIIIPNNKGGYIITQDNQICNYDWENNSVTTLHEVEADLKTNFNDGKCDPSGRLWTGTMRKPTALDQPEGICAMYSLETNGILKQRYSGISLSNGLAWSPDNTIMYHVDTLTHSVFAYDFNLTTGEPKNKRVVKQFENNLNPDGMAMDTDGNLWIAFYGDGTVKRINTNTGAVMEEVHLPDAYCVTSCCFGGKDFSDLYVTTSAVTFPSMTNVGESGGSLFCVNGLGVKGQPVGGYCEDLNLSKM